MSLRSFVPVAVASLALAACAGGAPSKSDVQKAVDALSRESPLLFGDDAPMIKEATCSETGKDMYDCVTSLAVASAPEEAHTVTVKMTKLGGRWTAQIPNIMG